MSAETIVFGRKEGPTHLQQEGSHTGLSWCGVKSQYRHWTRPGQISDVDCKRCLAQVRKDQPLAWKAGRP